MPLIFLAIFILLIFFWAPSPQIYSTELNWLRKISGAFFITWGYSSLYLSLVSFILSLKNFSREIFLLPISAVLLSTFLSSFSYEYGGIIGLKTYEILSKIPPIYIQIFSFLFFSISFFFIVLGFDRKIRTRETYLVRKKKNEEKDEKEKKKDGGVDEMEDKTETIFEDDGNKKIFEDYGDENTEEYNENTEKYSGHLELSSDSPEYSLPPLSLLDDGEQESYDPPHKLQEIESQLMSVLKSFQITGRIVSRMSGPTVNFFEFEPSEGLRASRIVTLSQDISIAMKMEGIRVIAPVPGSGLVGFEIPRKKRAIVRLKDVLKHVKREGIPLALGKDIYGNPFILDLSSLPHLLIAGTTGSGKSVLMNAAILSILYNFPPDDAKLILVDIKMLEFSPYSGIPNLVCDVITDPRVAIEALRWAVEEMISRYKLMKNLSVRDIDSFNRRSDDKMPRIIIFIDEFADLMIVAGRKVEEYIIRLSQMARAAGIHIVLATQRPSVNVITGVIKANLPARIALRVSSSIDSRVIMDTNGAENLLGKGDFLFFLPGTKPKRGQAAFVSDEEIIKTVNFLKRYGKAEYIEFKVQEDLYNENVDFSGKDPKYMEAVEIARKLGAVSISLLQRRLGIGFNRAARIVEMMEAEGLIKKQDNKFIFVG